MALLQELQAGVSAYGLQFRLPDSGDWQVVVEELAALLGAEMGAALPRRPGSPDSPPFRPPMRCRCAGCTCKEGH